MTNIPDLTNASPNREKRVSDLTSEEFAIYQSGFMSAENDWRRAMGFSDFGEAMYWFDLAKRYFMSRYGTIWPPENTRTGPVSTSDTARMQGSRNDNS